MSLPVDLGGNSGFVNPGQTIAMTVGTAVASGQQVVVFTGDQNSHTGVTITDTRGNTYAPVLSYNPGGVLGLEFWLATITTPLQIGDTITYTAAANTAQNLGIAACSVGGYGIADTGVNATSLNSFTTSYTVTGNAAAVSNEINFFFTATNSAYSGTPAGWTTACAAMGTFAVLMMYQINAGTGGLTASGNLTTSQISDQAIIALEPSGGGASVPLGIIGLASSEW